MSKEQDAIKYLKNYCEYDAEYDTDGLKPYYIDHSKYGLKNAYKKSVDTLEQAVEDLKLYKKAFRLLAIDHQIINTMFPLYENIEQKYLDKARKN